MIQKMTTLIFRSKIPYDELIKGIYFFAQIYFCFPENSQKTPTASKMADIIAPSNNTTTSLLKSSKASSLFFYCYICVGGIFKAKTRIFHLILNSRCVFKNHQYFMVLKSNFGAFFQDTFFLCGITPNQSRLTSRLAEMFFFSRI